MPVTTAVLLAPSTKGAIGTNYRGTIIIQAIAIKAPVVKFSGAITDTLSKREPIYP